MPTMPMGLQRVAQPPGGRSSFSFNDGSDSRMRLPPAQAPPPPRGGFAQAPGGHTSWSFDDHSGGGAPESARRHTNGVLKSATNRQPAGGVSSLDLSDGSSRPPVITRHRGDALDAFVRDAPAQSAAPVPPAPMLPSALPSGDAAGFGHRNVLAPPGGRSSFSFGWGEDASCNHHHHYHRSNARAPPMRDGAAHESALGGRDRSAAAFERAFAADQGIKSIPRAPGGPSYGASGLSDYTGGGARDGWARPSVHVAAPPGGASSIVFG